MGRFDYVPQVLAELGVRVVFHKVAQRPGKPLWFGVGAGGQTVYALPGNPVSTLVCLARYVLRGPGGVAGSRADGRRSRSRWRSSFEVKPALSLFVPVQIAFEPAQRHGRAQTDAGLGGFHLPDRHRRLRGAAARAAHASPQARRWRYIRGEER